MAHAEICAEKEVPLKTPATEVPSSRDILEGLRGKIESQGDRITDEQRHLIAIYAEQNLELLPIAGGKDTITVAKELYAILANDPKIRMEQARKEVRDKIIGRVITLKAVEVAQRSFDAAVRRYYGLEDPETRPYLTPNIRANENAQSGPVDKVTASPTPEVSEYTAQRWGIPASVTLHPVSDVGQTLWQEKSQEWQEVMVTHIKDISELGPVGRKTRIDDLRRLSMVRSLLYRGVLV